MSFGDKLKQLRINKKVTQQQLADYLGVGRTSIAGYEAKKKHPDYDKLKLIAQFFSVSTDFLLEMPESNESIKTEVTLATHRTEYGEDLPEEAREELEGYLNYLRFKYKKKD